ncbi:MAG: beta-lactamase family protein [Balneolales bacterium]|nr:beta-lactamase family protein [Balneolales bacterium]
MKRYIQLSGIFAVLFLFTACDLFKSGSDPEPLFTPERVNTLQSRIDSTLIADKIPGTAIVVVTPDGERFEYGAGFANLETRTPMQVDHRFRIGSITKTFIATVVLQLADENRLSLDASVQSILPEIELRESENISVRDLLRHTSGIPNYTGSIPFLVQMFFNPDSYLPETELIAIAESSPRLFEPGEMAPDGNLRWGYSNTNYTLLGLIIERVTSNSIQDEIHNRISAPLGLSKTYYATTMYIPADMARGYMDIETSDYAGSGIPGDGQAFYDITALHPNYAGAAGAMVASAPDLAVYAEALMTGMFYSTSLKQQRDDFVTSQFASAIGNYGLGIAKVGENWVGHKGGLSGYELSMYRHPEFGVVIVLSNKSPNGRRADGTRLPDAGPALFNTVVGFLFDEPYIFANFK